VKHGLRDVAPSMAPDMLDARKPEMRSHDIADSACLLELSGIYTLLCPRLTEGCLFLTASSLTWSEWLLASFMQFASIVGERPPRPVGLLVPGGSRGGRASTAPPAGARGLGRRKPTAVSWAEEKSSDAGSRLFAGEATDAMCSSEYD
jgi:hypothetical protein